MHNQGLKRERQRGGGGGGEEGGLYTIYHSIIGRGGGRNSAWGRDIQCVQQKCSIIITLSTKIKRHKLKHKVGYVKTTKVVAKLHKTQDREVILT